MYRTPFPSFAPFVPTAPTTASGTRAGGVFRPLSQRPRAVNSSTRQLAARHLSRTCKQRNAAVETPGGERLSVPTNGKRRVHLHAQQNQGAEQPRGLKLSSLSIRRVIIAICYARCPRHFLLHIIMVIYPDRTNITISCFFRPRHVHHFSPSFCIPRPETLPSPGAFWSLLHMSHSNIHNFVSATMNLCDPPARSELSSCDVALLRFCASALLPF